MPGQDYFDEYEYEDELLVMNAQAQQDKKDKLLKLKQEFDLLLKQTNEQKAKQKAEQKKAERIVQKVLDADFTPNFKTNNVFPNTADSIFPKTIDVGKSIRQRIISQKTKDIIDNQIVYPSNNPYITDYLNQHSPASANSNIAIPLTLQDVSDKLQMIKTAQIAKAIQNAKKNVPATPDEGIVLDNNWQITTDNNNLVIKSIKNGKTAITITDDEIIIGNPNANHLRFEL